MRDIEWDSLALIHANKQTQVNTMMIIIVITVIEKITPIIIITIYCCWRLADYQNWTAKVVASSLSVSII